MRGNQIGAKQFGVEALFWDANLAKIVGNPQEIEAINKWIKNPKYFLLMMGSAGVGKTYLAIALLNYFFEIGDEVYYINTENFFQYLQDGMKDGHSAYSSMEKFLDQDILIIDDLGSGQNTVWQIEMLLRLINSRYESMKPTIVTTNLNMASIDKNLGFRIASRLSSKENLIIARWEPDRRRYDCMTEEVKK